MCFGIAPLSGMVQAENLMLAKHCGHFFNVLACWWSECCLGDFQHDSTLKFPTNLLSLEIKKETKDDISQPLTIKIKWSSFNHWKMPCNVTSDKFSWTQVCTGQHHTRLWYKTLMHWDKNHMGDVCNVKILVRQLSKRSCCH